MAQPLKGSSVRSEVTGSISIGVRLMNGMPNRNGRIRVSHEGGSMMLPLCSR